MRLAPSTVISLVSLFVALGSAGYAATGGNLLLGFSNDATSSTRLAASVNGPALIVANPNAGAAAAAFAINVAGGHAPFTVNSATKIANLNADYLDGLDSTQLPHVLRYNFNVASGGVSGPFAVPPNVAVQAIVLVTTVGLEGISTASLFRRPAGYIEFNAVDSPYNSGAVPSTWAGFSGANGTRISYIDFYHQVRLEVSGTDALRVTNDATEARAGTITLIW